MTLFKYKTAFGRMGPNLSDFEKKELWNVLDFLQQLPKYNLSEYMNLSQI